jgi:hypothetical protein
VKIIIRTLIILAAAMVVVGATMAYASSGFAAGSGRDGFDRRPPAGFAEGSGPPGFIPGGEGARPEGFGDRPDGPGGREGGRGAFGASELLKNVAIIAVIIAVVSLLSRLAGGLRRQ